MNTGYLNKYLASNSVGSFVISCIFFGKAKTHVILKEYVITFKKIRVTFFLHILRVRNPRWRPNWPPFSNNAISSLTHKIQLQTKYLNTGLLTQGNQGNYQINAKVITYMPSFKMSSKMAPFTLNSTYFDTIIHKLILEI